MKSLDMTSVDTDYMSGTGLKTQSHTRTRTHSKRDRRPVETQWKSMANGKETTLMRYMFFSFKETVKWGSSGSGSGSGQWREQEHGRISRPGRPVEAPSLLIGYLGMNDIQFGFREELQWLRKVTVWSEVDGDEMRETRVGLRRKRKRSGREGFVQRVKNSRVVGKPSLLVYPHVTCDRSTELMDRYQQIYIPFLL